MEKVEMMYMKGRIRNYPVIFEKTSFGNYKIIFPDLNMKFDEETLSNCRIIAKLYMEKILRKREDFKTKEIDSKEKLKKIYFRRTKKHIRDFSKIRIEYIEVEEKVY
jgi:hypothetical protein